MRGRPANRCQAYGCKAEAQRMLRIPKVHVCEAHYLRNKKALQRMARARYFFKQIVGEYAPSPTIHYGIHYGIYSRRDNRRKRDKLHEER